MKIKENYVLRNVAGENLVVSLGDANVNFNSIITLNETGKLLWENLQDDTSVKQLTDVILREYEIDRKIAEKDVLSFINSLKDNGILKEH